MGKYVFERIIHAIIVLAVISMVTFVIIQLAPGGPAILNDPNLTTADVARIRHNMGLDQPILVQYISWLAHVLQGDLGRSFQDGQPVLELILSRLPATLLLSFAALLVGVVVIVGALTFFPALTLGPVLEHFAAASRRLY